MDKLIIEIPPISDRDYYYLQERYKPSFNYPLHKHNVYELNFIEHGAGARRIVGDSFEPIGEYELTLVGCNLEHVWEQYECKSVNIHEITIQMPQDLFSESLLRRRVMKPLKDMLDASRMGITFGMKAIMTVYTRLIQLTKSEPSFAALQMFQGILYDLAASGDYHSLASSNYARAEIAVPSRRIQKIKDYIDAHYAEGIRIDTLAELVNMTSTAFSRFFKQRTNRTVSNYISEVRLSHASQMLIDTTMNVVEISLQCGFPSISNFNRVFRSMKGMTPKEFRDSYKKNAFHI